ncbi:hypothetical protein [Streptomyces sp. AC512_CC834]|uniref:hypothetical protein n=1 Tax=Streptomyces sp. AC512_CC834 TaxID=2823691 RepID=UPI001C26C1A8|nr:hypothetical protein [Streptomyces sp. AC512_CC834]
MTEHVMAATDASGKRLGERVAPAAPTLDEAAEYGNSHRVNYVSVRHGHAITLYGRDATGTWSVLAANAPAPVVVEIRRQHDDLYRPEPARDDSPQVGFEYAPAPEGDYVSTAVDVDGEPFGERVSASAPTLAEAARLGDLHETNYVVTGLDGADVVTLYGRGAGNSWSVIAADVDVETAEEVCLWFDLTQHYQGPAPAVTDLGGDAVGHPLDHVPAPEGGRMAAARAISLVVDRIRGRRLDYPTQGLAADRFDAGWSVYAPVDIDETDPMAFLDMPVGRSVFLVSDIGRVKETSSSIPPQQAQQMFTAEEAYVRRPPAEERLMADLRDEVTRLDSAAQGSAGISSFTVDAPSQEMAAARASRLLAPITQQLALLGPDAGWDRFAAVFSFTVSGEVARLRFWSGNRSTEVRVPEQTALLVRRQRHLAAWMPAGPWWRLLLTVSHSAGTNARITTDYDYGDQRLPDDHLLSPEQYRDDLAAYPRAHTPEWLSAYVAGQREGGPGPRPATPRTAPRSTGVATTRASDQRQAHAVTSPPVPVIDTQIGRKRLYADPQVITFGRHSLALDEVEWVGYAATHTATKRFLFPTTHDSTWEFAVGRYPYYGGPVIRVPFYQGGRRADQPAEWTFLVNLARQYLEPRLLTDMVARIRRGETITVGGSLKVNRSGITCAKPRLSLPRESIGATQLSNGMICVYRTGVEKPVLTVPLSHPNASLIPDLVAELTA